MAINVQQMSLVRPGVQHGATAAARLPFIQLGAANISQQLASAAQSAGFTPIPNTVDQYQHADGSWVVLAGGTVQRGHGGNMFRGVPQDLRQLQALAVTQVGAAAIARVPVAMSGNDVAGFTAHVTQLGFMPVLPNYFSHADGSWIALIDNAVIRGFGGNRVNGGNTQMPQAAPAAPAQSAPAAQAAPAGRRGRATQAQAQAQAQAAVLTADQAAGQARRAPAFEDGFLTCAHVPFVRQPNLQNDRAGIVALGMVEKSPGYFEHADGSWVAYASSGRVERGVGQQCFQGVPQGPARLGQNNPSFQQFGLAIADAKLAKVTAAAIAKSDKVLLDAGFTKTHPNFYRHQDQSFVAVVAGNVYFGQANAIFTGPPSYASLQQLPIDINTITQSTPLWNLPSGAKAVRDELTKRGFTEARKDFFQSGQTWVAIEGSKVFAGMGGGVFPSLPDPAQLPQQAHQAQHKWLAIVKTAQLKADDPTLAQQLGGLGFRNGAPGFYQHQDGSWIAVNGKNLIRGAAGIAFSDVPTPPKPGDFPVYTSIPSNNWQWYQQNTALGRTPVMGSAQQAIQTLPTLGYAKPTNGSNYGRWQHPDGSWFDVHSNGALAPGFQQWRIGQLPYNNRIAG